MDQSAEKDKKQYLETVGRTSKQRGVDCFGYLRELARIQSRHSAEDLGEESL